VVSGRNATAYVWTEVGIITQSFIPPDYAGETLILTCQGLWLVATERLTISRSYGTIIITKNPTAFPHDQNIRDRQRVIA
jgi:hypothetical protein